MRTVARIFSVFTSSTTPFIPDMPETVPMTRTVSPFSNEVRVDGFSVPSAIWLVMRRTSAWGTGDGLVAPPTNPVIFGVFFTRCMVLLFSSISTKR